MKGLKTAAAAAGGCDDEGKRGGGDKTIDNILNEIKNRFNSSGPLLTGAKLKTTESLRRQDNVPPSDDGMKTVTTIMTTLRKTQKNRNSMIRALSNTGSFSSPDSPCSPTHGPEPEPGGPAPVKRSDRRTPPPPPQHLPNGGGGGVERSPSPFRKANVSPLVRSDASSPRSPTVVTISTSASGSSTCASAPSAGHQRKSKPPPPAVPRRTSSRISSDGSEQPQHGAASSISNNAGAATSSGTEAAPAPSPPPITPRPPPIEEASVVSQSPVTTGGKRTSTSTTKTDAGCVDGFQSTPASYTVPKKFSKPPPTKPTATTSTPDNDSSTVTPSQFRLKPVKQPPASRSSNTAAAGGQGQVDNELQSLLKKQRNKIPDQTPSP